MTHPIKLKGSQFAVNDWICVNCHGVMRMGKIVHIHPLKRQFWLPMDLVDGHDGKFHWEVHAHEKYTLMHYGTRAEDDSDMYWACRTARPMCEQYHRRSVDVLLKQSRYKSRDGRLIFKDGSSIRLNDDESRTLYSREGVELDWPSRVNRN